MTREKLTYEEARAARNIVETLWFIDAQAYGAEVEVVRTPKGVALSFEMTDAEADSEHLRPILIADINALSKALRIAEAAQREAA